MNKLERMGRRRFMENLAAIGVSGTTLSYLDQEELSDLTYDPEEEIPYVAKELNKGTKDSLEREAVYKTIERDEWERRQTALDARAQVSRETQEIDEDVYASFTDMQSPTDFGVKVYVPNKSDTELEEVEDELPEVLTGEAKTGAKRTDIPVVVEEITEKTLSGSGQTSRDYQSIPGGVPIISASDNSDLSPGTLGSTFFSEEYGCGWVTAGHLTSEDDEVYLDITSYDDKFGITRESRYDTVDRDYAFVDMHPDEDERLSHYIIDEDGDLDLEITGIVTDEELENQQGNQDFTLHGHGRSTGRTQGSIEEVVGLGPTTAVITNNKVEDGDSGGPLFEIDNGDAHMAGIMFRQARNLFRENDTKSTTAQFVEEKLNGHF